MTIFSALIEESIEILDNAYARICHCVDQLDEEHIWMRPNSHVNSIGIIIKHGHFHPVFSKIGRRYFLRHRSTPNLPGRHERSCGSPYKARGNP